MVKRRAAHLYPVLVVVCTLALAEACGQAEAPAGSGGTCQLTSDCQEGYVCITQPDGTRQCSNDLAAIQQSEEAGPEAAAMMPTTDGAAPQGDGAAPPQESGTTPPPPDSGSAPPPPDSGSPPKDSGSPPKDSGSPPEDTGSPPQDTGAPPSDTGAPPQEAGE